MKKIFALALCASLMFGAAACNKNDSATMLERKITQQLLDAKYIDADIVSGTIGVKMGEMGYQNLSVNGNVKTDTSSGFPKLRLNGNLGIEGLMSLPFKMYMDESKTTMSLFGQTQETPVSDDLKNQLTTAISQASQNQASLSRTVQETTYNDGKALEMNYDINQLNTLLEMSGTQNNPDKKTTFEKMTLYYLLNENNDIHSMVVNASTLEGTDKRDMNFTIKFNSIGQPFDITNEQTDSTQQQATNNAA